MFDTMISPILTENSEIWGVYAKPDFNTWDRSKIGKTCKRQLEVKHKANIGCRAELGRFSLSLSIKRILEYILHIHSKEKKSFVKQYFVRSFDLHCNGKSSFYSNLIHELEDVRIFSPAGL